jgi:hypothetical protein
MTPLEFHTPIVSSGEEEEDDGLETDLHETPGVGRPVVVLDPPAVEVREGRWGTGPPSCNGGVPEWQGNRGVQRSVSSQVSRVRLGRVTAPLVPLGKATPPSLRHV